MGVETELLGLKNRYDGKEFQVIEREDGTIAVIAGGVTIADSGVLPVTATPSGQGRLYFVGTDEVTDDLVSGGSGGNTNLSITTSASNVTVVSSSGADAVIPSATVSAAGVMSASDKAKLDGIATAATANATDAQLRDRTTHTGNQPSSTISDFNTAVTARLNATSIDALSDVSVSGVTVGQVLKWSGTNWVNDVDAGGAGATNLSITTSATTLTVLSDTGTDAILPVATTSLSGVLSAADKTKLDGIATGAAAVGSTAGAALGTAAAGVATTAARSDHVHAAPTAVSGNAGTATALQTARTISLSGDVTGSVSFNGTANVAITATVVDDSHLHSASTISDFAPSVGAQIAASSIDALADVNTSGATAGKVLQFDGVNWLPATPAAGSSVTYANVRFVSTTGNDATAVVGDMTKPYLNVKTAVDACVAGDTVMLLPGTHTGVAPLILKNGCTLTSLWGKSLTTLKFSGAFLMQGGTGPTTHGGQIQPSTGVQGTDFCNVRGVRLELAMATVGGYAMLTGVNTATGSAIIGTGATYADMYISDCDCIGVSDVHVSLDAKSRTYFKDCYLESSFDFCHLIGPTNSSYCEFDSCKLVYRPWYDLVTDLGTPMTGWWRVRSGELCLRNCTFEFWNDGRTDWVAYNIGAGDITGGLVDDFAGATVRILGGLPVRYLGAAFPNDRPVIPRFSSSGSPSGVTAGVVITDQPLEGLCDSQADSVGNSFARPVRVVPLNDMTLKATVFAGATTGKRNNTYKCDAAATSQTFYMVSIPPNTIVKRVWTSVKTAFAGGAGTVTTVEVGTAGVTTKYIGSVNIRTTGVTMGSNIMQPETTGDTLTGTGTLVQIIVRNTGANVATLTAGEVDVFLELAGTAL